MTNRQYITKFSLVVALLLIPIAFVVTGVAGASEVTGTLSGGASSGSTITGTVLSGSNVSGTIGGTSGGGTVTGTVSSGGGGGSSGGGGGGGSINGVGSVLGVSTDVSNAPPGTTGGGAVLGVSTDVPNTGAGGNAMMTLLFIFFLSLVAGLGTYAISRRVIR